MLDARFDQPDLVEIKLPCLTDQEEFAIVGVQALYMRYLTTKLNGCLIWLQPCSASLAYPSETQAQHINNPR
jgi:hypothetical protein